MGAREEMTELENRIPGMVLGSSGTDSDKTSSSSSPWKFPRPLRQRLLLSNRSPSTTIQEIEAKLKDADLRRQQFHELLSSKARSKRRSPSWAASQVDDLGHQLEAELWQEGCLRDSICVNFKINAEQGEILSRKLARLQHCCVISLARLSCQHLAGFFLAYIMHGATVVEWEFYPLLQLGRSFEFQNLAHDVMVEEWNSMGLWLNFKLNFRNPQ